MTSDSMAAFPRYRRHIIDIRSGVERLQIMNPTNGYLAFNFRSLNEQSWTIFPSSGIIEPSASATIEIKIINLTKSSNRTYQFKLRWIEVKRTGLIANYVEKNKQQFTLERTPSNLLSILLAQDLHDESTIQERLLCVNLSAHVRDKYLKPSSSVSSMRRYQLKAVPQSVSRNFELNAALPILFSTTKPSGKTSLLSLRNVAKDSILIYKILVYGKQRPLFSVHNSWGIIQPDARTTIQFKSHGDTGIKTQGGLFKMLWCLIPLKGEIGDWVGKNVHNDSHQLQGIQARFPGVRVNMAMLRTTLSEDKPETQMEDRHVAKDIKNAPKINSNRKLVLKCVMGKSLGIYQWQ
jgi:MSP (Major sperm protein) domain